MSKTIDEGKKGIIKSVKPFMENGVHQIWESPKGGRFYKFWYVITSEGKEISSNVLHKSDTSPVKEGDKITFTLTREGDKSKISQIKKDEGINGGFKSNYNNPSEIAGASFTQALNLASEYFDVRKIKCPDVKTMSKLAHGFHEWMMKGQETPNKDLIYQRRSVLESVLKRCEELKTGDGSVSEQIITIADDLWKMVEGIKTNSSHDASL
jgi:hypothetical protein